MSEVQGQITVGELERMVAGIRSRSGVERVANLIVKQGLEEADATRFDAALTTLLDLLGGYMTGADDGSHEDRSVAARMRRVQSILLNRRANVRVHLSQTEGADADAQRALILARELGDRVLQASALNTIAINFEATGELRKAIVALREAIELDRVEDKPLNLAVSLHNLGMMHMRIGEYDATLALITEAERIVLELVQGSEGDRSSPARTQLLYIRGLLQRIYREQGDLATASRLIESMREMLSDISDRSAVERAHAEISLTYHALEAPALALHHALEALHLARELEHRAAEADDLILVGDVYVMQGDPDKALLLFQESFDIASECGHIYVQGSALSRLVRVHRDLGNLQEAEEYAGRALNLEINPNLRVHFLIRLGRICFETARLDEAERNLNEARNLASMCSLAGSFFEATYVLGMVKRERGEKMEAERLLQGVIDAEEAEASSKGGAHKLLADICLSEGRLLEAIHHFGCHHAIEVARMKELADQQLANLRVLHEVERLSGAVEDERKISRDIRNELARAAADLAERTMLIERIERELRSLGSDLSKAGHGEFADRVKTLRRSLNEERPPDDGYLSHLHDTDADFLRRLRERHPDLTSTQVRLCSLLRSGMGTGEIASILHISVDSVLMQRKRLRKKLDLDKERKLEEYLSGV